MKIKILSDQHFEFRNTRRMQEKYLSFFHSDPNAADVCIIAGDIDQVRGETLKRFNEICQREKEVIYVPGNHDYYNPQCPVSNIDAALAEIEKAIPNLHVLRSNEPLVLNGQRFLGDTMWVRETSLLKVTEQLINDPWQIKDFWKDILPKNQVFRTYLEEELKFADIVVTHHLPSYKSTPPAFLGSPLQPWFVCVMEALIMERQPKLWVHGHTHSRCDYFLGSTRVFCNPVGYPSDSGNDFSKSLPCVLTIA